MSTLIMATLINLPHEIQYHISNFLRPHTWGGGNVADLSAEVNIDPLSKARDIANIKAVHSNLTMLPLWKYYEWKNHIRQWRDAHMTYIHWKYQYGVLPVAMIKQGWEKKINNDYRHQHCYVETMVGKAMGTGFVDVAKEYKVIWFEVSLLDLITGVRPLPHCFGHDGGNDYRADNGVLQLAQEFVPAPSLETLIPLDKRLDWLKECFCACVLKHWGNKMVEKRCSAGEKPDFIKEFKNMMDLPSDYELSQTDLFKMFLKELNIVSRPVHEKEGYFKRSQNIEDLCRQEINLLV